VTLHLPLEAAREPIPDAPAVYVTRPHPPELARLAIDLAWRSGDACKAALGVVTPSASGGRPSSAGMPAETLTDTAAVRSAWLSLQRLPPGGTPAGSARVEGGESGAEAMDSISPGLYGGSHLILSHPCPRQMLEELATRVAAADDAVATAATGSHGETGAGAGGVSREVAPGPIVLPSSLVLPSQALLSVREAPLGFVSPHPTLFH